MKSEISGIGLEPIVIFIRFASDIERISFSSSSDHTKIQCQSRLMFTGTYLRTFYQRASLLDEVILESPTSPCACYRKPISTECIPEMPCHISKLRSGFLPQFECSGIVSGKIRIYRNQVGRYVRRISERMISAQVFLERIITIKIKSWRLVVKSETKNKRWLGI
jgi:hypothetical protein